MVGDKKVATTDLSEQVKIYTMEKTGKRVYHRPQSMFSKTTGLPAIEYPHPGTSYNPTIEDHQALIKQACQVEVNELEKEAKIRRQIGPMLTKIPVVQKDVRSFFLHYFLYLSFFDLMILRLIITCSLNL